MSQNNSKSALTDRIFRLMEGRDFQAAGMLCEQLTSQHPEYDQGFVTAAEFFLRVNNPSRALELVTRAVGLSPLNADWRLMQARCQLECGMVHEARSAIHELGLLAHLEPHQHNELGLLLARIDEHAAAQLHYMEAVHAKPGEVEYLFNLATSQRFLGDIEAAEKTLDTVLGIKPTDHEAAAMRSSLRKARPDSNHVEELEITLANLPLTNTAQTSFCYALAKELEDLEQYSRSFQYLRRGADLRKAGMQYRVETDLAVMDGIIRVFDQSFFEEPGKNLPRSGSNEEAIFVIGLPRSGTTLLERILASHTDVHAAGELGNFGIELTKLTRARLGSSTPDRSHFIEASRQIDFARLGENYIRSTRPLTGHTPRFIDKLPFNYLYAGLIHRALPDARIISLHRHPMDSCYAMYKQLFRDAYPFSYSLHDLGCYYLAYHRLMSHWNSMMPGVIHTVRYEDLVNETETEARRLLAFCDLEWQDNVLEFHRNKTASTTASATQVRQKVYTSSVGKWRCYEKELQPLKVQLERAGIDCS